MSKGGKKSLEKRTEVFANLKNAFEEAVDYVVTNGMPEEIGMRRPKLMEAVQDEASQRLDNQRHLYRNDVVGNIVTGRMKYQK